MIAQRSIGWRSRRLSWRQVWVRYATPAGVLLSGLLLLALYGFALRLPFFRDDLPIMTWLQGRGWHEIWLHASENSFYRPLAFTVYKLGLFLPVGTRQVILHAVPLLIQWASAFLLIRVIQLCGYSAGRGVLAALLFVMFPFNYNALPWVTALSHPLVTMLTLLAVYGALRAVREQAARWWALGLLATALAPFSHESGAVTGVIVAGMVLIQRLHRPILGFLRTNRRLILLLGLGILLNIGAVLARAYIPGVGEASLEGLSGWFENGMFFLHGLLYPVAPAIGWLVNRQGWHDFTLLGMAGILVASVIVGLVYRTRNWRWVASGLWWWACGSLPAALSFRYGYLTASPRLYGLASAGIVMVWAGLIIELAKVSHSVVGRRLVWAALVGVILLQNGTFLFQRRTLFTALQQVYRQVLQASSEPDKAPFGFVNLPAWLAYPSKTYALVAEGVEFLPNYTDVGAFIAVNQGRVPADDVMFTPVLEGTKQMFGFRGEGLNWDELRQFARGHGSVWLTVYRWERFALDFVGSVTQDAAPAARPLVRFQGGPLLESASLSQIGPGEWALALTWWAWGAVEGDIFVHVRDAAGDLIAQADGPALGGMVPIWLWQRGDRIDDVRHLLLPVSTVPHTVQVGVYNAQGRLPALLASGRAADDAPTVVTFPEVEVR